ncbi:MAG: sporulation protein YunB [Clostridium sp.]|uniref:sporulation protein YunB n=1 Tax=Clostridium sp. TaxID=1506 RepID=UPI0029074D38|nr:sporulation protein YunB [Clostridium sp.]MDU7337461.1 sporulation protein YunB [Clostridium sp.]
MKRWHKYRPANMPYRGERKWNGFAGSKIVIFLIGVLAAGIYLDIQLVPAVESLTVNSARQTAVSAMNESVLEELNADNITYDDLISLQRDSQGKVQTITTNMAKTNEIKAKITNTVQQNLHAGKINTSVPLGTLLGSRLLHGRGPDIPLVVTLKGNVESDFKTKFESAGINQTRHQIYLELHTEIYSFIPGLHTATDVTTSVLVAETVIVGDVPQLYLGG